MKQEREREREKERDKICNEKSDIRFEECRKCKSLLNNTIVRMSLSEFHLMKLAFLVFFLFK